MAHTYGAKARSDTYTNPVNVNVAVAAGTTVVVAGIVTAGATNRAGGAPTFAGITMTQYGTVTKAATSPETTVEMWYLLDPPNGATYGISVPNTNNVYVHAHLATFKAGTGYISALDAGASATADSATNPTVNLTTTVNGDAVFAVVGTGATTWAPTARTGTQLFDADDGSYGNGSQYLLQSTAGSTDMGWTFGTADDWAVMAIAFKEVTPPTYVSLTANIAATSTSTEALTQTQSRSLKVSAAPASTTGSSVARPTIVRSLLTAVTGNCSTPDATFYFGYSFDTQLRFTGSSGPLTSPYTCGAGATVLVLGIVVGGATLRTGGAPTYNGITMTQADETTQYATSPETSVEMWYFLDPPVSAEYTISVPNAGGWRRGALPGRRSRYCAFLMVR
jgi:hypothetical protein